MLRFVRAGSAAGAVAAAIITGFFVFAPDPELFSVASADGKVIIEGVTRESQPISIEVKEGSDWFLSPVYEVSPKGVFLDEPVRITFQTDFASEGVAAYGYDEGTRMWEVKQRIVKEGESRMAIEVDELGSFALGPIVSVEAPNYVKTFGRMLELAPETTVGYEYGVGVSIDGGPVIRLPEYSQVGGCGGVLLPYKTDEWSQLKERARILVSDVEQEVEMYFVSRWMLSEEGCIEGKSLEQVQM